MVGVPVIINHKDLNKDNADDERIGVVNSVWYDEKDGWYWCDGIIWDETAQNLITDKKWSVSCSYDVKTANDEGGSENNIKYDMEFLDGVFTHLALVDNPRYERANIVLNSKTEFVKDNKMEIENENNEKGKWVTIKGTHVFIPDGKTIDEVVEEKFGDKANKQSDKDRIKIADLKSRENEVLKQFYEAKEGSSEREHLQYELDALKDERFRLEDKQSDKPSGESNTTKDSKKHLDRIEKLIKKYNLEPHEEDELLDELGSFEAKFDEGLEPREEEELREQLFDFEEDIKRHHEMKKDEGKGYSLSKEYKNHVQFEGDKESGGYPRKIHKDLESAKEFYKYKKEGQEGAEKENLKRSGKRGIALRDNPVIVKNPLGDGFIVATSGLAQKHNLTEVYPIDRSKAENSKEQDMALIEELKKLITKVENDKEGEQDMTVENEKVDKRKLIDEVGGILKGKVDDEIIRTIIGKLEKVAYDESEAGKADNEKEEDAENCKKVKNEDEKDEKEVKEVKKEVKEDVENKCKNSVDNSKTDYFAKLNEIYNSASRQMEPKTDYVSRADREQAAIDYFAR